MKRRPRLLACAATVLFLVGLVPINAGPAAALSPPVVDGVSKQSGPTAGGTPVRITGLNFVGTTAVKFNGVNATSWLVIDDFLITAVTPSTGSPSNTLVAVEARPTASRRSPWPTRSSTPTPRCRSAPTAAWPTTRPSR